MGTIGLPIRSEKSVLNCYNRIMNHTLNRGLFGVRFFVFKHMRMKMSSTNFENFCPRTVLEITRFSHKIIARET